MQIRRIVALGALALLLGLALWLKAKSGSTETEGKAPRGLASESHAPAPPGTGSELAAREAHGEEPPRSSRGLDKQARDELLVTLGKARNRRLEAEDRVPQVAGDSTAAALHIANKTGSTSEWEERQLQTLRELLGECYELAAVEEPGLAGTFGLRFSLAAEPEIGGLVDDVSVMEDYSSIAQATMRECMLESIYALELDPPPQGVRVDREITLRFDDE